MCNMPTFISEISEKIDIWNFTNFGFKSWVAVRMLTSELKQNLGKSQNQFSHLFLKLGGS